MNEEGTVLEQLQELAEVANNKLSYYQQNITTAGTEPTNQPNTLWVDNTGLTSAKYPSLISTGYSSAVQPNEDRIYKPNTKPEFMCSMCLLMHPYTSLQVLEVISQERYQNTPSIQRSIFVCSEACMNVYITRHPL